MFTQRSVDVRVRDNQENRSSAFPKTPGKTASNGGAGKMPMTAKHANMGSSAAPTMSAFMTPAQPSRAPLGAKSTNVHLHRQFTSAKTGKRHSPVTAMRPPPKLQIALDPAPALAQPESATEPAAAAPKLEGIAALRAALDRALETGIDVPDVEYAPPPVEELPFAEPDNMYPMDWDAFEEVKAQRARYPLPIWRAPHDDPLVRHMQTTEADIPPFIMMNDDGTMPSTAASTGAAAAGAKAAPRVKKVLGEKTNRATQTGAGTKSGVAKKAGSGSVLAKSTSSNNSATSASTTKPARLGSFAAPTAAARAKTLDGKHSARPTTTRSVSGSASSLGASSRSAGLQRSLGGRSSSTLTAAQKRSDAIDERVRENELLFNDNLPPATLPDGPDLDPALFRFDIKLEDI